MVACCMMSAVILCTACNKSERSEEEPTPTPTPTPDPPTEDTTLFACDKLCTPNPSAEAQNLYTYLRRIYGKKILSGAMATVNWNTNEAHWVQYHAGAWPAITCFDMIQSTMSDTWAKNTYSSYAKYEDWWANNGIVAGMWHHMVPKTQGTETWSNSATYKPNETTFNAENATTPGTWEYNLFVRDLDTVAHYLKGFQDRKIPILWRPLHEAAGKWFWWGKTGAAEVAMWQFMFDRFVNVHGLNNLIWVWTTQGSDNAYYPGDEYVDIIARDIYNKHSGSNFWNYFNYDFMMYPNKMHTLSECGNVSDIKDQWEAGAKWSWFMPWYDSKRTATDSEHSIKFTDTITAHEHAPISWWRNAYQQEYVISRDEMPSLK